MTRFPELRPRVGRKFYVAHGLGNDYVVMEEGEAWGAHRRAVRLLCDRWEGVGSDGLVVVGGQVKDGPTELRMFNPDGSEFERSGNGLRIAASWLLREDRVEAGRPFSVQVGGDVVQMEIHAPPNTGRYDVSVAMGRARVGAAAVGLSGASSDPHATDGAHGWLETPETGPLPVHLVSVGNPHCVVFADTITDGLAPEGCFSSESLARIGPGLTGHPRFAHGANVQLARVLDPETVGAKIWERGVGATRASGTSACAVAVAAVESKRLSPGAITVQMDGGAMQVTVTEQLQVTLRGPVQEVCEGELTTGFASVLAAAAADG